MRLATAGAVALGAASFAVTAAGAALGRQVDDLAWVDGLVWALAFLSLAVVGTLLAVRRPRNPIGWLFLVAALSNTVAVAGVSYGELARQSGAAMTGLPAVVYFLASFAWMPGAVAMLVLLPLLFPDGRPPSRRWLVAGWCGVLAAGLLVAAAAGMVLPHPELLLLDWDEVEAVHAGSLVLRIGQLGFPLLLVAAALAVASLIVRFVRSAGAERAQLKWFAYAATCTLVFVVVSNLGVLPRRADLALTALTLPSMAVAVGVAVLRYRLYDIDRIVSRTVTYALVTAVLAGVYIAGVSAFSVLLAPVAGGGEAAVAASTLAAAGLFRPTRRRVQQAVDRRFNRPRYDMALVLAGFRSRLRDEVGLEDVTGELLHAATLAVQPARAGLSLAAARGERP